MSKTKISEFSTTPGDNTDINGINIAEGCAPSGINNAIRELMSDLKEWQSGAMDVYVIPQGTAAAPGIQLYGDLDTGLYGFAANQLGVAVGGASAGYFSSAGWVGNVVATTVDLTNIEVTNIKAKDGTTSISLADSTGIATFSKATVIETTDNTNAALRITQLGTGNALLVEDATNPDTTPTVIDQFGNVILGTTARTTPITSKIEIHGTASELSGLSPSLGFYHWSATASLSSTLTFRHYPSGTVGTLAANTSGDVLGRIVFLSYDGTNSFGAVIRGVSGTGGTAPSITYDASGGHNFTNGPIDVETLEVTNIKARDGTAAASIADSTGVITVTKDVIVNGVTLGKGLGSVLTNTALGRSALAANMVGDLNTAVGNLSLTSNTGGTGNTAVGHVAMTSHQGGSLNTAVGAGSLTANLNGNNNTAIGQSALGTATGSNNTAVGSAAGSLITNGNKNTIIGNYDGNQGGLDIRTASNYIVLSDGDGNPRAYWNGANATFGGSLTATTITGTQVNSDNLRLDGNTLSSTDTNGNIVVTPNGTGITTFSNYLKTGNLEVGQVALGTNLIKATNTNGGIYLQTNGTGLIFADAASIIAGNASATTKITTNGASDLVLDTNDGSNSGSITIEDGVNGNIIIAPNGTGQVQITNAALDLTTIEVTNIKAKDGTASITLADSTGQATFSANPLLNAGTANGVPYLNASKVLTTGSALTFDGTNLGIGTNSPLARLNTYQVNGGGEAATLFQNFSTTTNTTVALYLSPTNGSLTTGSIRAGFIKAINVGGGVTALTFGTNASGADPTEKMRIDSAGNVGIGTNSPAKQLDLAASNTGITTGDPLNTLRFTDTDTTSAAGQPIGRIEWYSADADTAGVKAYIQAQSTDGSPDADMVFATNHVSGGGTAERMRIQYDGNVGIGNSNPTARLEVVTSSGTATAKIWSATNTTPIADLELQRGTNATWGADVYGDYRIRNDAGVLLFQYGESSTTTERMRIDSSGNLGLGVTPSAWNSNSKAIEIGEATAIEDFAVGGANPSIIFNNAYRNTSNAFIYKVSDEASYYGQYQGAHSWYTAPSGTAGNAITFTERANIGTSEMVVNDPGNDYDFRVESDTQTHMLFVDAGNNRVGIGTSSPGGVFHTVATAAGAASIGGILQNADNSLNSEVRLLFAPNLSTNWGNRQAYISGVNVVGGGTATELAFGSAANGVAPVERMRIDKDGNVRVGTAALATTATNGFLYIPTCAGTPTGTPTAITGLAPMVIDSTNNKLYIYSGGAWVALN